MGNLIKAEWFRIRRAKIFLSASLFVCLIALFISTDNFPNIPEYRCLPYGLSLGSMVSITLTNANLAQLCKNRVCYYEIMNGEKPSVIVISKLIVYVPLIFVGYFVPTLIVSLFYEHSAETVPLILLCMLIFLRLSIFNICLCLTIRTEESALLGMFAMMFQMLIHLLTESANDGFMIYLRKAFEIFPIEQFYLLMEKDLSSNAPMIIITSIAEIAVSYTVAYMSYKKKLQFRNLIMLEVMHLEKLIYPLIFISAVLLAALIITLLSRRRIKKNLADFSREIEKMKDSDYAQPLKVTSFDRDITELANRLNELTDMSNGLAAEYEREKQKLNNLISGISHDFRTPLTASLGYLQLLEKNGGLSGKDKEHLHTVIEKNKYLKELSDEFFELSKLDGEAEEIETEDVNLSNLLSDMVMEQFDWLKENHIDPEFDIADGIVINSSSQYLTRIIQNLLSNSRKYGEKRFGATLTSDSLTVFNDIADTAAIDPKKVFEPFYKGYSRSEKGTGLGLYVVKQLSEKLGYSVSAELTEDRLFIVKILFKGDIS